jgi:hypothetical protein
MLFAAHINVAARLGEQIKSRACDNDKANDDFDHDEILEI